MVRAAILDREKSQSESHANTYRRRDHGRPASRSSRRSALSRAESLRRHATRHPNNPHHNRYSVDEQRAPR